MSVANVITLGYGSSFGSPANIITLGYLPGTVPPVVVTPDTHDLPWRKSDIKRYKDKLKRDQELIEAREAEKLAQAADVREQIERALHPERFTAVEEPAAASLVSKKSYPNPVFSKKEEIRIATLKNQLNLILAEAEILAEQHRQMRMEAQRIRDEEDMKVLLPLLSLNTMFRQ